MKKFEIFSIFLRILFDGIAILGGLLLAFYIRMYGFDWFGFEAPETLVPFVLHWQFSVKITLFLLLVFGLHGRYNFFEFSKKSADFSQLLWSFSAGFALVVLFFFFSQTHFFSRLIFGLAWVIGYVLLVVGSLVTDFIQWQFWKKGLGQERIIILGKGALADQLLVRLSKTSKFLILDQLDGRQFGGFEKIMLEKAPDEIFLATEDLGKYSVEHFAHIAHKNHVRFSFVPDELALDLAAVETFSLKGMPMLRLRSTKLSGWGKVFKALFDRIGAVVLIVLLSPVFIWVAIKTWWQEKNAPIFYVSDRVGINGQLFRCIKFRSMVVDAEKLKVKLLKKNERPGGVLFKMKDDPRVTPFGQFIRKWSIDELPQLFNVLLGDMSLVGPRPHLTEEVKKYSEQQHYLFTIKPGMTGFAQVNGQADLSFEEEMKYELFYLKNWSMWLDLVIFLKTVGVVLRRKNY